MESKILCLIVLAAMTQPLAAQEWEWAFSYSGPSGSGVHGSGDFFTVNDGAAGRINSVVGITGTAYEADGGGAITGLLPFQCLPNCANKVLYIGNFFGAGPSPGLAFAGIGFTNGIDEIDLFNNLGQDYDITFANFATSCVPSCNLENALGASTPITLSITWVHGPGVPEPSTLSLLCLGLVSCGFVRRRRVH